MVFAFAGDSTTTSVLRKDFASAAEPFALRPFAFGAAFFAVVLALAMFSWGGSRCRHSRFGSRPTLAAEEILPGFLVDEPFQLQLRQESEGLVGAKLRLVCERVHMDGPGSVEELPHPQGWPFERFLDGHGCGQANDLLPGRPQGVPATGELLGHR